MGEKMKENQTNRALLLILFGEEWLKKRDKYFKALGREDINYAPPKDFKPKQQLELIL